jgi:hypothetical protein
MDMRECSVLLSQPKTYSQPGSNNHSQTIPRKTAVSSSVKELKKVKEDRKSVMKKIRIFK